MKDENTLVKMILAGDVDAWHRFVETHSDAMRGIIGRYVNDEEIARDLFVALLDKLKTEKLAHFDSKSTLSTWLFIVTVNHCRDYFRSTKGVRHVLTALKELRPIDKRYFKLAFIQALPIHEVLEAIRTEMCAHLTYLDLIECEERIVATARRKKLGRIIEKLLAPPIRQRMLASGMQPLFNDLVRMARRSQPLPDLLVETDLFRAAMGNLREALLQLPYSDRLILQLRFEHKASARMICEELDLGNENMVYRRLERLVSKLKTMLLESGIPLDVYEGIVQNLSELRSWEDVWNTSPDDDRNPFH
jgi:RNA polymerase sigma factor (sigma-70 family)